ncbi:MAG: aminotransferase class I/II-fold pyridoxal phosphate-dependent enzyme, partial [Planctomycetes bacterium]|nr:aminotransferase class I/II-fold pyridoxal phosphate-dependent enzyme [Planctomycetota bacterium]
MFGFKIPLAKADITEGDILAVTECLRSGIVSNGPQIKAFEDEFARFVGANHAIAVSSGTAALHLSLLAAGVTEGSEVITSPFSFIASANSIRMCGAKPVFVDIDARSFNLDPALLEAAITDKSSAILPVDIFGLPHDPLIDDIANSNNLPMIVDSCEALGAEVSGDQVGSSGTASCFGFYANKQLTTGEGGMITTDDTRV